MSDLELKSRIAELEERLASAVRQSDALHAGAIVTSVVLAEMRNEVPFDSASVQELRGGRLVIVGGIGFADLDVIIGESFDVDNADTPNGEVVHRRRPIIVPDTERYRAFRRGLHVGAGIRSWLGVPLIDGKDLIGMIALDKAEPDFYDKEHQRLAMAYAAIAAKAMRGD